MQRRDKGDPAPLSAKGFRPTCAQKMHLALALQHRGLGPEERAKALGLSHGTWLVWWKDRDFRSWWNEELYDAMSLEVGPALHELRLLANDPKVEDRDKIRAVEVFLGHMQKQRGSEQQAAVLAILNAFSGKPSTLALRARKDAAGNEQLEAMVSAADEGAELGVMHATPSVAHAVARSVNVLRDKLAAVRGVQDDSPIPDQPAPLVPMPTVRKRVNAPSSLLSEPGGGKARADVHLDDSACTQYPSSRTPKREREDSSTQAGGGVVENHAPLEEPSSVPRPSLSRTGGPGAVAQDETGAAENRGGVPGPGAGAVETVPGDDVRAAAMRVGEAWADAEGNGTRTPIGRAGGQQEDGAPANRPAGTRRLTADDFRAGLPAGAAPVAEMDGWGEGAL